MTTTDLYRIWNAEGELLYIGISVSAFRRLKQHRSSQPWRDEISKITVETYPSRAAANDAERVAIRRENPKYNKQFADPYALTPEEKRSMRAAIRAEVATWPPLTPSQLSLLIHQNSLTSVGTCHD